MAQRKRIAILGFNLESNRFAMPCSRQDFEENMWFAGETIREQARAEHPSIHLGIPGFYSVMDAETGGPGGWEDAPVLVIGSTPAGPVEEAFFNEYLAETEERLRALMPVDGVYICQHGGACAVHTHDPDGEVFALVRRVVGEGVPVIATLDLHANVSDEMMEATDLMIGYRTNPHVDLRERGEEAARAMLELVGGVKTAKSRIRLPLVAPSVTQLTAEGHPYGDLIRLGQTKIDADVLNVTILSGFAFCDTPKNGMTVIVTTRGDQMKADRLCEELAAAGWADRHRYVPRMTALDAATAQAKAVADDTTSPTLLFADPADNPGGGGRGNTTYILKAFLEAGVTDCLMAVFYDRAAVQAAKTAGVGAKLSITLNSEETDARSEPLDVDAEVLALSDGVFVGSHGMVAGKTVDLGDTAALKIGGITVVCISKRTQCLSPDYMKFLGLDPDGARSMVVKSRGHFRAGFSHMFPPERIIEVDVPGLTSPNLSTFDWQYLPRPVFPLDGEQAIWPK